ncbi:hypothetical protein DMC14_001360 [Metamycoplasma phocicerebrale]|uniref:HTH HARE-type domain-containing protein n=1 Tax=Metamycoplasma phocicerebrale TaxID=142649 RepID=A0A3T0TTM0_9BACT|nr:hypothetical protein [Metamycoplasma phocicerebrale]AZZ65435.1 hypothetical protein DMC14_001360 [Metamycoplasma phocicerebrale]
MKDTEYKTLLDIAEDVLKEKESLDFATLFNKIKEVLFNRWRMETNFSITDEQLLTKKRGELYRLLTIDGRFFHNIDGTWTTIRPEHN